MCLGFSLMLIITMGKRKHVFKHNNQFDEVLWSIFRHVDLFGFNFHQFNKLFDGSQLLEVDDLCEKQVKALLCFSGPEIYSAKFW